MRDGEFLDPPPTCQTLLETWEDGRGRLFEALESLSKVDLVRTVTIRGELHSVKQAINRQAAHYGHQWKSLSVPRNQSVEFNRQVASGQRSQR